MYETLNTVREPKNHLFLLKLHALKACFLGDVHTGGSLSERDSDAFMIKRNKLDGLLELPNAHQC